ncbi:pyruvate, water dikinase [Streptomyces sp. 3213]|uniref:PEP/pyruvate-binding domain-containing protein n=1 Tax=Streptomyces sp. 3213.3 TaxID=1855348 RepID=UPI00089BAC87|nr:PEP/pyruvate-binding domain-containing protein [Streptomyces sp. 3213.3]SED23021.1 pyruvate, water dikinase [Streptomyces sp. 3213] [Streptomyces sp. 3213.3]
MTTLDERHGEGAREAVGAYRPAAAVPLDHPTAAQPGLAGSKAANLARAAAAGLPVLPGFVIPEGAPDSDPAALRRAWQDLSDSGALPLVVRSSSPQEDTQQSSLAGQFASVLDVRGWPDFVTAVRTVLDSAHRPDGSTAPMAVLVQPMLAARVGGVMFGADPVEGRADRMLVSAVRGGPDSLVSGEQAGTNYWLSRRGRLLRTEPPTAEALLTPSELRRLARLARRARQVFGGPQDIEFGFDGSEVGSDVGGEVGSGRLWLFQSRPITAMAVRPPRGARLLGPGPVAETLPEQLQPLEEDLWVTPMARGLAAALDIAGSAPRRLLRTVPVVTTVGGWAAADLRLLGAVAPRHRWLALLNPAPGARRLGAAWRVGRLTAALPGLAADLVADVDRRLTQVPAPGELPGPDLAATLRRTRAVLVSLHAQEALAGALLPEPPKARTAAGAGLSALAGTRALGIPDDRAATAAPTVLALTAPSLRGRVRLPGGNAPSPLSTPSHHRTPDLPPREALRLRIRWVQELQARLVREAARRLGLAVDRVGLLRWPELAAVLEGEPLPADLPARVPQAESPPLPDAFRLAEGTVVAEHTDGEGEGRGVSGGRAAGTVWDGTTGPRPADAVLIVRTLDPALAPLLPGLAGLVAQTGSPLSHLAVLAREFGLPAVVGATDAVRRFPPGSRVTVDGTTGEVRTGEAR